MKHILDKICWLWWQFSGNQWKFWSTFCPLACTDWNVLKIRHIALWWLVLLLNFKLSSNEIHGMEQAYISQRLSVLLISWCVLVVSSNLLFVSIVVICSCRGFLTQFLLVYFWKNLVMLWHYLTDVICTSCSVMLLYVFQWHDSFHFIVASWWSCTSTMHIVLLALLSLVGLLTVADGDFKLCAYRIRNACFSV